MIPPLAVALYAYATLCLAMAALALLGHKHHAPGSPYRTSGLYLAAMATQAFGTAWLTHAPDLVAGARAQNLQFIGQAGALIAFVDFQQGFTRDEPRWQVWGTRALTLAIAGVTLSGGMLDSGIPLPPPAWSLPFAVSYPQARVSFLGIVAYAMALAIVVRGVIKLRQSRGRAGRLPSPALSWRLVVACEVATVAVVHDQLVRFGVLGSVFLLEPGALLCILVASTDIALRFADESDELRRRTRALEDTYWQLSEAQDRLVHTRRLAAIGELSAVIAHEVRNPLAVIKNAAAGLRRRETLKRATRGELVGIIREEVDRLKRLVEDMLTYAKPLQLSRERHDPEALALAAIERARCEPGVPAGVPIEVKVAAGQAAELSGDGRLLVVALSNIVSNALRATPAGYGVSVQTGPGGVTGDGGAQIEWTVCDQGPGMDAETCAKATAPFFTTRPKGTGLGLAIAERVADAHGGELCLESQPSLGTVVHLRVPAGP